MAGNGLRNLEKCLFFGVEKHNHQMCIKCSLIAIRLSSKGYFFFLIVTQKVCKSQIFVSLYVCVCGSQVSSVEKLKLNHACFYLSCGLLFSFKTLYRVLAIYFSYEIV